MCSISQTCLDVGLAQWTKSQAGLVGRDMLHSMTADKHSMTADKLLCFIDISALSGPCVLAHVISLVGWPKHVNSASSSLMLYLPDSYHYFAISLSSAVTVVHC